MKNPSFTPTDEGLEKVWKNMGCIKRFIQIAEIIGVILLILLLVVLCGRDNGYFSSIIILNFI